MADTTADFISTSTSTTQSTAGTSDAPNMEQQAATLLQTLKRPAAPSEAKIQQLQALKSDVKHYRVPENAQSIIFECVKAAITQQASATLASTAFSTLGHLLKRLKLQDASGHAIRQLAPRLFPAIQDRLGDLREPVRAAAAQALTDLYPFCAGDVEQIVLDEAIGGSHARAKEAGMKWVVKMHNEEAMPFKGYVSSIVARLEDADGTVREAAKAVLIELFSNAPDRAKTDLKKQLKAHSVRHSIATQILAALDPPARPQTRQDNEPDLTTSTRSLPVVDHIAHFADTLNSEAAQPPPVEAVPMDPIYVHTQRELEDVFRDMLPHFEGKETEQNWMPRDKAVLKIRRLLKGNAANEFHATFMAGIKSSVEGILKVANSLRTTMSSNGCQLVQELAKTLGPALDPHVEIFLQSFIKMSAATKHIAAENGRITADIIFQNCSYHVQMMRHIWIAAQEKNAQVRQYAPEWLRTVLKRQSSYKHGFESSGGLELAEKCIKKGLDDANPKVKEGNRVAFWVLHKTWPEKGEAIMSKLDPKMKTALERHPGNPHAALHQSHSAVVATARPAGASSRTALREMLAEQRKAKAAGKVPARPNSAMADLSPVKSRSTPNANTRPPSNLSKVTNRNVSSTSTASAADPPAATKKGSSLMSGPVRRPRRPEVPRPQTADPYSSRRMLRPETPASNASPSGSPGKGTGASKASFSSSTARNRAKATDTAAGSPAGSPAKHSPALSRGHYQTGLNSRPTSKGSVGTNGENVSSVRSNDFSNGELKNGAPNRGAFSPGHKRAIGQSASMDSGIPTMADDEGFTMVIPDLRGSQSRARSPLAYRNPMKAMFDDARERVGKLSPEAERSMRRPSDEEAGQQQGGPVKSPAPQLEEVQIYEDPFVEDEAQVGAQEERKVLGELPVNENVRLESPPLSVGSNASPTSSPRHVDSRLPIISTPQDRTDAMRNRKLLDSGIQRIRSKALDAHGFRRVQELAKSKSDIWDGGKKYDELMAVLLDYLRAFDREPKLNQQPHKAAGLKTQALGLVRALLALYRKDAVAWHGKALVSVLVCRQGIDVSSHILADIQRTADEIVQEAVPESCIDAILDFLPLTADDETSPHSVAMALSVLRQLLVAAKDRDIDLGVERRANVAQATARFLGDVDAEVRKADVELASELFEIFGPAKAEFWTQFKGVDEGRLGLLTYYIAKKGKQ